MSIIKSNGADITSYLDQVKEEFVSACRFSPNLSREQLKDNNNIPIRANDMVWLLPDGSNKNISLGRVIKLSKVYVTVHLGYWPKGDEITIRKHPDKLLIVSPDEVKRIIGLIKSRI